jgi:hypothetical protein
MAKMPPAPEIREPDGPGLLVRNSVSFLKLEAYAQRGAEVHVEKVEHGGEV